MDKSGYSIWPKESEQQNIVGIWVQAILHGFIVNKDGIYQIRIKFNGNASENCWITLAKDNYRDDAFDAFSRSIDVYMDELESGINAIIRKMGDELYQDFLNEIRNSEVGIELAYYNNYSQSHIKLADLKDNKNYIRIADLFRKEFTYLSFILGD